MCNRRDFLRLGALGLPLPGRARARSCVVMWQSGGLSHLDSFDPKPAAPREIRGEFRAIPTSVPGLRICEHLPRLARQMHKLTLLRSMSSSETNHERAQAWLKGFTEEKAGSLSCVSDCSQAVRAVEAGARTVLLGAPRRAYDTHTGNFPLLRETLLPQFDRAFTRLIEELEARGLLRTTLVIATGEFGRSPRINGEGGRDHHARCWSAVLAGAGLTGGRVLGSTDRYGEEVTDFPVTPADLLRTVYAALDLAQPLPQLAQGRVVDALLG